MALFNHASTLAFAWWDTEEANDADAARAGLFRRIRTDLVPTNPAEDETSEALMVDVPFDSYEDPDAERLDVIYEATRLSFALYKWARQQQEERSNNGHQLTSQ